MDNTPENARYILAKAKSPKKGLRKYALLYKESDTRQALLVKPTSEDEYEDWLSIRETEERICSLLEKLGENMSSVRDFLFQADQTIIWDRKSTKGIQGLNFYEPADGNELHWWLSKSAFENECWVPSYIKDVIIASHVDGNPVSDSFLQHLKECQECMDLYEAVKSSVK